MKTTKKVLISVAFRTLAFTAVVAVTPVMAQSSATLPSYPAPYLEQVMQFEQEYGPYDRRLAEPLQAAAVALAEASDPLQASQLYQRALHITRINDGLYSESQIVIVESLIDCLASLEDWAEVDRHFRYLHLLYTRLYESGSAELERGLAQVSDWHVIAINEGIGGSTEEHLREANKLFRQRLQLAEQYGQAGEQVMELLRRNLEVTQYNLRMMNAEASISTASQLSSRARGQLAQTD